jgi:hypothetical protein
MATLKGLGIECKDNPAQRTGSICIEGARRLEEAQLQSLLKN